MDVQVLSVAGFALGAIVSLATSWLLVSRLERLGERLGLTEALLGVVAALAADAPEITAAISAISGHQQRLGAGVVLGSNVFNLAALLGLSAVVAGQVGLHRKVVALGGAVAMWVAAVSLLVVTGLLPVLAGLVLALATLVPYVILLGTEGQGMERLRLPQRWWTWLRSAVTEEEIEFEEVIRPGVGRRRDVGVAAGALVVVVGASVVMEHAASETGRRYGLPQIIVGGLILAAVTSLPNAVAAVYLARRGRAAATLSTALNSNTVNVVAGLMVPGVVLGLGQPTFQAGLVTAWYAALSLAVVALAYIRRGLGRGVGLAVIASYLLFAMTVTASGLGLGGWWIAAPCLLTGLFLVGALLRAPRLHASVDHKPVQGGRQTDTVA
jgi:cation:H+ antiporter